MKNSETGKSRGFGFVTFKDVSCVAKVLANGPHEVDNSTINDCLSHLYGYVSVFANSGILARVRQNSLLLQLIAKKKRNSFLLLTHLE
ncbi:hypothetical protein CEXT_629871 [Caerostris extrusa]|uniref:RRM domain-containing protein n=1 Tax=Caerostris extrusa TaxID=172846 RepID=A0AAV4NHD4_CAEEX|nr:hypothetical protein CEXT_629871 [Caerostris extrusa]